MDRPIPGMADEAGAEVFYAEAFDGEGFFSIADGALKSDPSVPLPGSGGITERKVRLLLDPSGDRSLLAMSYTGDLAGWRGKLVAYCRATGRVHGVASSGTLRLSDGAELALADGHVVFEP